MAAVKKGSPKNKPVVPTEQKYSKKQILESARYVNRRDLVDALLDENKSYAFETVDKMIETYKKGQVN